jgi:adenine phosphoribosyltransferase
MDLKNYVRSIPNFPLQGIIFRDITTVLKEPQALRASVDAMTELLKGVDFDLVLGPESRGFIFGMPLAYNLNKGFVPVRKAGKLPAEVVRREYALEYGTAVIEIHKDAIKPGQKIVVADDLLATGGTAKAIVDLVTEMGANVAAMIFFIELVGLDGRRLLEGCDVRSVLKYYSSLSFKSCKSCFMFFMRLWETKVRVRIAATGRKINAVISRLTIT